MVKIQRQLDRIQQAFVCGFYGILKISLSLILGFISAKCEIFENFSPFSLILLSLSPDIALEPTFCYLGSALGILSGPFDLSVFKYITALTMIYIVYMVFRKSLHIIKSDTAVLSGACCFIAGFLFLLVNKITLFGVLILVVESVLICCCIYFIAYAVRGFKQCCRLSSRELIAAVITMVLILIAFHNVYLFSMSVARITALALLFLALCCLKTSHSAVLGSCLGIILAAVGNGGEAIFTAVVVGTLAGCVFSTFSDRFALSSFVLVYFSVLFFFGKFPWNYWYFGEPLVAYAAVFFIPKKKIRAFLSAYIAVKTPKKQKRNDKNNENLIISCQNECNSLCSKATICYKINIAELSKALETLSERYLQTNSLGEIETVLSFCIKPNAMEKIIERQLICNLSQDYEELVEQLEKISKKIEQKMDATTETIRFLNEEEKEIRSVLEKRKLVVNDINFVIDDKKCKKCTIQFNVNDDILYENIIREVVAPYFTNGFTIKITKNSDSFSAYIKESNKYEISCSALCKTRNGEQISGDTALGFPAGRDRYYLILADGMGSGKEAGLQSNLIINSLRRMISGGLSVVHALNVYRSVARFRQENYFTTIDICSIDLNGGMVEFYKAGAFDSYLLHGQKLQVIHGGGLPLGLSEHDNLRHYTLTVHDGDFLILASDGLSVLQDQLNELIPKCCTSDVRDFAKNILRSFSEIHGNTTADDITIMVCKFHEKAE